MQLRMLKYSPLVLLIVCIDWSHSLFEMPRMSEKVQGEFPRLEPIIKECLAVVNSEKSRNAIRRTPSQSYAREMEIKEKVLRRNEPWRNEVAKALVRLDQDRLSEMLVSCLAIKHPESTCYLFYNTVLDAALSKLDRINQFEKIIEGFSAERRIILAMLIPSLKNIATSSGLPESLFALVFGPEALGCATNGIRDEVHKFSVKVFLEMFAIPNEFWEEILTKGTVDKIKN